MKMLLILVALLFISSTSQAKPLVFGVVPQQSAKKLAQKWGPLLAKVSKVSNVNIVFATAKNIPTFEKRLAEGHYDFAYMNPYHMVVFNNQPGYNALVKQSQKKIKGVIVVRRDSPVVDLEALRDKTLAFPAPAAFAASILPRGELLNQGISFKPQYVSSHDSVYLTVAKGLFPAGGGVIRTLKNTPQEIQQQLRVLWTTNTYTPHAIAAHPRLDHIVADKVQNVLIDLHQTSEGKQLLASLNFNAFESAENSDWDDVRELKINTLMPPAAE